MRALFLALACGLALTGCSSLLRENGDYFQAAGTDQGRFDADDQACTTQARDYVSFDLRGMSGTNYARNRGFNAVYGRCMRGRGYAPRPYFENWFSG